MARANDVWILVTCIDCQFAYTGPELIPCPWCKSERRSIFPIVGGSGFHTRETVHLPKPIGYDCFSNPVW